MIFGSRSQQNLPFARIRCRSFKFSAGGCMPSAAPNLRPFMRRLRNIFIICGITKQADHIQPEGVFPRGSVGHLFGWRAVAAVYDRRSSLISKARRSETAATDEDA